MKVAMALLASAALFCVLVLLATWRESGRGRAMKEIAAAVIFFIGALIGRR